MNELPTSSLAFVIVAVTIFASIYLTLMTICIVFWVKNSCLDCCHKEQSNTPHGRQASITVDTEVRTVPPPSYSSAQLYPNPQLGVDHTTVQVPSSKGRTPPPSYKSECTLESFEGSREQSNIIQTLEENVTEGEDESQNDQGLVLTGIPIP